MPRIPFPSKTMHSTSPPTARCVSWARSKATRPLAQRCMLTLPVWVCVGHVNLSTDGRRHRRPRRAYPAMMGMTDPKRCDVGAFEVQP